MSFQDVLNSKRFGVISQSTCDLYLNTLVDESLFPEETNIFFEMFLEDNDGKLLEVPVLINQTDTLGYEPSDDWQLVRRFFIYDTLSGVNKDSSTNTPSYIRYANDVKLKVQMDSDSDEAIYRPYLVIRYAEMETLLITETTTTTVYFSAQYFSDYSSVLKKAMVWFIIVNVITFAVIGVRFYFFVKRNPQQNLGDQSKKVYTMKFLYYLTSIWGEMMFWFLFVACFTIFVTYKGA